MIFKKKTEPLPMPKEKEIQTFPVDPQYEAYFAVITETEESILSRKYPCATKIIIDKIIIEMKDGHFDMLKKCIDIYGLLDFPNNKFSRIVSGKGLHEDE